MDIDSRQNASVSIDGAAIREIREEKRLTQLYVAKVVGVTTDTVSRWENNRYPTIRRDNALKLAEALEVPVEEILKRETEETESVEREEKNSRLPSVILAAIAVLIAVVGIVYFSGNEVRSVKLSAERLVPAYAAPGNRILVRVHLTSDKPLKGMILREVFPPEWNLVASEPAASGIDNEKGKARWIFRKPQMLQSVAYILQVPQNAEVGSKVALQGELIANPDGQRTQADVVTVGKMEVQPLHWADRNGNQIIEDHEILEVSEMLEETGQLNLDWDFIEKIWDAGGYTWDQESSVFKPVGAI
ncbi:transcriptional regulator, XRE family [Malonomonas rubra DSM 5091]|uniref:Transcriptional regulator, XRE family n=1 Tax=Malonomonas rubra DSM 5091 TaxID=1122189 RepID=A0A1M6B9V2_MALRU|nr:helix-turn-helix transcriptional regulator [Malonomonas rubra]SHI45437.1 transcriptional regulator, XRE family [Malonomonas rubra DSM 5091]